MVKKWSKNVPKMVTGEPPTLRNGQKMVEKWSRGDLRPFLEHFSPFPDLFFFQIENPKGAAAEGRRPLWVRRPKVAPSI